MRHEALRGFLQLGFFLAAAGFFLAWFQPPDSAEFVVSICSSAIGLILVLGSIAIWRWLK